MKTGTHLWTYETGVDEMSTEAGRGHIVVDTGPWIFGRKRMIPAGAVRSVDHADRTVRVSMTKDQIKDAPDASELRDEGYFEQHTTYYGRYA